MAVGIHVDSALPSICSSLLLEVSIKDVEQAGEYHLEACQARNTRVSQANVAIRARCRWHHRSVRTCSRSPQGSSPCRTRLPRKSFHLQYYIRLSTCRNSRQIASCLYILMRYSMKNIYIVNRVWQVVFSRSRASRCIP